MSQQTVWRPTLTMGPHRLEWIALALTVPMFVSAILFHTYDIAMKSVGWEVLRQLNAPFLLAEVLVILMAYSTGFRPASFWPRLGRAARVAVLVFLSFFWVGGIFTSLMPSFATLFNLTYLVHAIFGAAVMYLVQRSERQSIAPFAMIIALSLVVFTVFIATKFANPPIGRAIDTIRWQFAIPGMISLRLFGAILAPFATLFCYLSIQRWQDTVARTCSLLASAFTSALLAWTGTRAGVLGVAMAMIVAVTYFRVKVISAPFILTGFVCLCGALVGMAMVPYGDPDFLLFITGDVGSVNKVSSGRFGWWLELLAAYREFPVFGAGPGSSAYILGPLHEPHIQPHNFVLEFLLNWGLVATLAALFLLGGAIAKAHSVAREDSYAIPFVLMADCLLVIGLFDGTFHFAQHLMLWVAAMAIALAAGKDSRPSQHPSRAV